MSHHPNNRNPGIAFMVCMLGMLFYFSQREANALNLAVPGAAITAAFSTFSTATQRANATVIETITVSGSLAPTRVVPVHGSLAPSDATHADAAERFSTQPDDTVQEIEVTGSLNTTP
jgi:hypothetical protein